MTKVLVFGTFDGVHDGHRSMLREAKALGSWLIAVIAPDHVVSELKGKPPRLTSAQRITLVKNEHIADEVVLGDTQTSSWKILKKYKPDIIALGYDQDTVRQSLLDHFAEGEKSPTIITLSAHKPHTHHNRLRQT